MTTSTPPPPRQQCRAKTRPFFLPGYPHHPLALPALQDEVKTELVLKGGTRLAFALWKGAGPNARRNCSLVACNLAVGKVREANTLRHTLSLSLSCVLGTLLGRRDNLVLCSVGAG